MKRTNYFGVALIMSVGSYFISFGAFVTHVDCSEDIGQELDGCQQMNKIGNNYKATKRKHI